MKYNKFDDILKNIEDKNSSAVGGYTACLTAATGVSLLLMVINISSTNKNYIEYYEKNNHLFEYLNNLKNDFLKMAIKDEKAFNFMKDTMNIKAFTSKEKEEKNKLMQEAFLKCYEPSYSLLEKSVLAIEICEKIFKNVSNFIIGDVLISTVNFESALTAGYCNCFLNLKYIKNEQKKEIELSKIKNIYNIGLNKFNYIKSEIFEKMFN